MRPQGCQAGDHRRLWHHPHGQQAWLTGRDPFRRSASCPSLSGLTLYQAGCVIRRSVIVELPRVNAGSTETAQRALDEQSRADFRAAAGHYRCKQASGPRDPSSDQPHTRLMLSPKHADGTRSSWITTAGNCELRLLPVHRLSDAIRNETRLSSCCCLALVPRWEIGNGGG